MDNYGESWNITNITETSMAIDVELNDYSTIGVSE